MKSTAGAAGHPTRSRQAASSHSEPKFTNRGASDQPPEAPRKHLHRNPWCKPITPMPRGNETDS
eukprot:2241268-Alexandrium_andersonii.AAC.2